MSNPTYADFHVHTHLSPCGKPGATAEALIHRARDRGIAAIGFADHLTPHPVPGCDFYKSQRPHLLDELRAEIDHVADRTGIEILIGVEADYTLAGPGCIDSEILTLVDHVVCAASHFHLPAAPQPADETPRAKAALMLRMAREALVVPGVSIWAHPFDCSRIRPLVPILDAVGEQVMAGLIALANEREIAVEINGGPALHEDYRQAMTPFFKLAREMGARFTITADAHHPDNLERLDLTLDWAREMGLTNADYLTEPELRERQRRRMI